MIKKAFSQFFYFLFFDPRWAGVLGVLGVLGAGVPDTLLLLPRRLAFILSSQVVNMLILHPRQLIIGSYKGGQVGTW